MRTEIYPSIVERLPVSEFDQVNMEYRQQVLTEYRTHHFRNEMERNVMKLPPVEQRVKLGMGLNLFRGKRGSGVSTQAAAMSGRCFVQGHGVLSNDAVLFGKRDMRPDLMAWLTESPPQTVLHIDGHASGFFTGDEDEAVRLALEGTLERGIIVVLDWGAMPIGRFPYASAIAWLHNTSPYREAPDPRSLASRVGIPGWCQKLERYQVGPFPYRPKYGGLFWRIATRWPVERYLHRLGSRDAYRAAATLNAWGCDLAPAGLAAAMI